MENLWDNHPPYQIDGCFGLTAGVGEMLVGGYDGVVRILPSLPREWENGEFSGVVSRGGIVFDCKWQGTEVTYLAATARNDVTVAIRLPKNSPEIPDGENVSLKAGEKKILIG
jgi:alpha-L-fucosidase 2